MTMRLYVAGPMSGLPDWNYPAFFRAAEQLEAAGFEPINPARTRPGLVTGASSWLDFMRASLVDLSTADGIALLPGHQNSRGARLEVTVAKGLGLPVERVEEWTCVSDR